MVVLNSNRCVIIFEGLLLKATIEPHINQDNDLDPHYIIVCKPLECVNRLSYTLIVDKNKVAQTHK